MCWVRGFSHLTNKLLPCGEPSGWMDGLTDRWGHWEGDWREFYQEFCSWWPITMFPPNLSLPSPTPSPGNHFTHCWFDSLTSLLEPCCPEDKHHYKPLSRVPFRLFFCRIVLTLCFDFVSCLKKAVYALKLPCEEHRVLSFPVEVWASLRKTTLWLFCLCTTLNLRTKTTEREAPGCRQHWLHFVLMSL